MRAIALAALLAACGTKEPAPPAPGTGPTPVAPTTHGVGSSAPPPPAAADCATLNARFDDTLAHADNVCHDASDCSCYPGGLGANPTCGGVTDKTTAAALFAIRDQVAQQNCPMPIQCAASICHATCEGGRCR
jgi:hypothetical protein